MRRLGWGVALLVPVAALVAAAFQSSSQLPVGYWTLDDTKSPAADSAGNAPGAWMGPPTRITTAIPTFSYENPSALNFVDNGTDHFVSIANSGTLDTLQMNSYSISAWFRPASVPPGRGGDNNAYYAIVVKPGYHEGLVYDYARQFQFQHWGVDATGAGQWTGTGTYGVAYPPGTWYHVVATWDRPAGVLSIYVNGDLIRQTSTTPNLASRDFGTSPWYIGIAGPSYATYKWQANGSVDDVRLYNFALDAAQVGVLAAGVPPPTALTATTPTPREITLNWSAPPQPVTYTYNVERDDGGGFFLAIATGHQGTSFVDTNVLPFSPYRYRVLAVSVGTSGPSGTATATRVEPPPRTSPVGNERDPCGCGSAGAPSAGSLLAGLVALALLWRPCRRASP